MLNSLPFKVATSEFKTGFLCPQRCSCTHYSRLKGEEGGWRVGLRQGRYFEVLAQRPSETFVI